MKSNTQTILDTARDICRETFTKFVPKQWKNGTRIIKGRKWECGTDWCLSYEAR